MISLFKKNGEIPLNLKNNLIYNSGSKPQCLVPLNLFQAVTYHSIDEIEQDKQIMQNRETIRVTNPEFNYCLYDERMRRKFIEDEYEKKILVAYDSLNAVSLKIYFWIYCILYKKGGIYIDIEYIPDQYNSSLLPLLDDEHYLSYKDSMTLDVIVSFPYNIDLLQTIYKITDTILSKNYGKSDSSITGPENLFSFIFEKKQYKFDLVFNEITNCIIYNNQTYLKKIDLSSTKHISDIKYSINYWERKLLYKNTILSSKKIINFTNTITIKTRAGTYMMYSSSPCIQRLNHHQYIMNIRYVSYLLKENTNKYPTNAKLDCSLTINKALILDKTDFKPVSLYYTEKNTDLISLTQFKTHVGVEDVRLFPFNSDLHYIGTKFNKEYNTMCIVYGKYVLNQNMEILLENEQFILPNFVKKISTEKNWSFVNINDENLIIYKWYPLQICKINIITNKLELLDLRYNLPQETFINARGSTSGVLYNNNIWFICHTQNKYKQRALYLHFIAIFDKDMNYIRHSELFTLKDFPVEFCLGLLIENDTMILTFSTEDCTTNVGLYDMSYIERGLVFYQNELYI